MFHPIFVFVLSLCSYLCIFVASYDYCYLERDCPQTKRHIGCHPEQMGNDFVNSTNIPLSKKLRQLIIDTHNNYRNQLACGLLEDIDQVSYPPAAKMRELQWDAELEYLAGLHVEYCVTRSDECRVSSRYKLVGQSIGSLVGSLPSIVGFHVASATEELIKQWFLQHKTESFRNAVLLQSEEQTGNFFQIVNDRVSRLGCALALCSFGSDERMFLITCNYSYKNLKDEEIYTAGPIVTKCDRINSRPSQNYKCLCAASES